MSSSFTIRKRGCLMGALRLVAVPSLQYAPVAPSSPVRAKVLYLLNAREVLNTPFLAALDKHAVSVGRLAMVLDVSRATASRLVQGKPPSPEQEATVLARWGAK